MEEENGPFPWHLGVYDAHCHPTDTVSSVASIADMKLRGIVIMASRRQDQGLVHLFAEKNGWQDEDPEIGKVIPSFGWHPWFSHQIINDTDPAISMPSTKNEHYQQVVVPPPHDADFLESLPEPVLLSTVLKSTRARLERYPYALVGEVGLDRAFRIPGIDMFDPHAELSPDMTPGARDGRRLSSFRVNMDHQRLILRAQLALAGEMGRAASVHGVAAHGVLYDTIAATWSGCEVLSRRKAKKLDSAGLTRDDAQIGGRQFPPRICLHSFSGQVDALRQYLKPTVPTKVYVSFSKLVNFSSKSKKAVDTIKAVPDDRLLVESDYHVAGDEMDSLVEDIVRRICEVKGWSLEEGVSQLSSNWKAFVFG